MIRKWITIPLLLLLSIFLIASSTTPHDEEKLIRTFDRTGAKVKTYMLHYGSRIEQKVSGDDVKGLAQDLANELELGPLRVKTLDEGTRFEAKGNWKRNIQVELTVINDRPDALFVKPYIAIRAEGHGLVRTHLFDARNRLNRTLPEFGIQSRAHFSIQGMISESTGKRGRGREHLVRQVLKDLEASEVESMRTKRMTSVSAHTPFFNGGVKTKGGTMNVQVAAKAGDRDDQVILTLGTPIITIEY
ncbi:YwmB family TATA-box binding protein [Melghirimyces algeriensis]|uniref:TATA-box binding n=1 Tax=Melghirimyces algeriensis TaxID=910412 RepID=A0A521D5Q1_9BACL|nr:YwmB family TATA-box binding protein [Melghirimyces algeriensis]SMO67024.1 TATA-box binding [Melghirimyces algeriensis]